MSNVGKYVDRTPAVQAAGLVYTAEDGAGDALRIYSVEEAAEDVMKMKCKKTENALRQRPITRYPIIPDNQLKDVLSPELAKSRFVAFRERLTENMYFKKHQLGTVFELQSKPEHITNLNTTFGRRLKRSDSAYDVVLPKKDPDEVNREYAKWHDKYIVSHKHYFPSERITRHYERSHFNPKATFGVCKDVDITGGNMRRVLTSCDRLILIKKAQKGFYERTTGKLGRKITDPNISQDMVFGVRPPQEPCTVQSLMENVPPASSKQDFVAAVAHINKWRQILYRSVDFHMHDLSTALRELDTNRTGHLSVSNLCKAAHSLLIRIDERKLRIMLKFFNMIENECCENERVNYMDFWKLLIMQFPLPSIGRMYGGEGNTCPKDTLTTYKQLCLDMEKKMPEEDERTKLYRKLHQQDVTTTKDLVQPDIPMKMGLTPSDFEAPRGKEELKRIFKTVLPDGFDDLWQRALNKYQPEHELLSVNELRVMLHD